MASSPSTARSTTGACSRVTIGSPEYQETVGVGDLVWDDLTREVVRINRIEYEENAMTAGVWVDHEYLDGGRHPWELTPLGPWRSI
jgi:hypothetical protein